MSTLLRSRRRAEDFAALVDGTDRAVRAVDARADADLERLVGVATSLRTFAAQPDQLELLTPREEFTTDLRARLMTEAEAVLAPHAGENAALRLPRRRSGRERRLVAVASAAVLIGGTAGVAAAAQNALPGDALYPIKRGIEKAETSMSASEAGKGRAMLGSATDRLDEVQALLDQPAATGAPQVPATLGAFTDQARTGSDLLLGSYAQTRDPATIDTVRRFAADGLTALEAMSDSTPPGAEAQLRDAATTLRDIDRRASTLCPGCSDLPPLALPRMFLVADDAARALARVDAARAGGLPDNSHPVIVSKSSLRSVTPRSHGSGTSSGGSGADEDGTDQTSSTGEVTPSAPKPSETPHLRVKVKLGDKTIDTDDGLDQTVKTLLPDPTNLLP
jgi:hypothetical protein